MFDHDKSQDQHSTTDTDTVPTVSDAPVSHHRRRAAFRPVGAPSQLAADFSGGEHAATRESVAVVLASARAVALFQPPPDVPALPPKPRGRPTVGDVDTEDEAPSGVRQRTDDDEGYFQADGDHGADDADTAAGRDGIEDDSIDEDEEEGDAALELDGGEATPRRRRRRGGRRRRKPSAGESEADSASAPEPSASGQDGSKVAVRADGEAPARDGDGEADDDGDEAASHRRRRRRRREGNGDQASDENDPPNTVVHVRESRAANDEVTAVRGSTRLEAKKQRRREGRDLGRRRPPILTESEFLARRDSVERRMIVRAVGDRTQVAVLEDGVLAEHYVSRVVSSSMVGNVYLGRVQNVLPSMEAAFIDIGRGRNAVLYAGEVNWQAAGLAGAPKRIELALKSGDSVLVQVTKDPVGHKGARLTSQISLAGRYLVFVPGSSMTGISRRLPDKERARLKKVLREALPEGSGVIVRTAAEGATEEQIKSDIARLTSIWQDIETKTKKAQAPELLQSEPDLAIRVVRDIFNEDFASLVVSGDHVSDQIEDYIGSISPELRERVTRWTSQDDPFTASRIDEQLAKALDRKVWLPSGGSLVIDRTEAMTVVDVNTGKFTGSGGNLEETVTRNNLEAAEEIVRQLRLRDIGGIIVIDFIDMVLERNRDLVLRRLVECLGRDRTKHQVAEVTSLGLVQMTRKRIGQGLVETFSEVCEACNGRGIKISMHPVDHSPDGEQPQRRRSKPPGPIPGAPTPSSQRAVAAEVGIESAGDRSDSELTSDAGSLGLAESPPVVGLVEGDGVLTDAIEAVAEGADVLLEVEEPDDADDVSLDAADIVSIDDDLDDLSLDIDDDEDDADLEDDEDDADLEDDEDDADLEDDEDEEDDEGDDDDLDDADDDDDDDDLDDDDDDDEDEDVEEDDEGNDVVLDDEDETDSPAGHVRHDL